MKKYRKQGVFVYGRKRLVDVPVDCDLYKADNREEYTRARAKKTQVTLTTVAFSGYAVDVAEAYEKSQLLESLRVALLELSEKERLLIKYLYFDELTQRETAVKLKISQPAVIKRRNKIIGKLRDSLRDWL